MNTKAAMSLSAILLSCGLAAAQSATTPPPAKPAAPAKAPKESVPAKTIEPLTPAPAADAKPVTLKVGDKAPALEIKQWVKGDAVKEFEKGKVYVVEFWATWCGPCRESIPHLTDLAKANKNVAVIGVASSEHKEKDGTDKRLENLKSFVQKQGSKMNYHVGYDPDRAMGKPWMEAAGKNQIPTAFIVGGDGNIAWIGHPMDLEEPLAAAVKATGKDKADTKSKSKAKSTK